MVVPDVIRTKALLQLSGVLRGLEEFKRDAEKAKFYAEALVNEMSAKYAEKEFFRDQLLSLLANIQNLDGELINVGPLALATMKPQEILSTKQRRDRNRFLRKRTREQIVYDATSMLCTTCKLVRPDRLNPNHLALDSEENGSHFDYNFDNMCQCSHHSSDDNQSTSSTLSSSS